METLGRVNLLAVPFTSAFLDIRNWHRCAHFILNSTVEKTVACARVATLAN